MRLATRDKLTRAMRFVRRGIPVYSLVVIASMTATGTAYAILCLRSCGPVVYPPTGGVTCGGSCWTKLCDCFLYSTVDPGTGILTNSCDCDIAI
jgi:hypothetical protein